MTVKDFQNGDFLYQAGDRSVHIFLVIEGTVEILKSVSNKTEVVGMAASGSFIGEISVIIDRRRSTTARVTQDGTRITLLDKDQFLRLVCGEPDKAYDLITRLCERLHATSRRSSDNAVQKAIRTAQGHGNALNSTIGNSEDQHDTKLTIFPETVLMSNQMPQEGIVLADIPFIVGRKQDADAEDREKPANWLTNRKDRRNSSDRRQDSNMPKVHLPLIDTQPFRLSRIHFLIQKMADGKIIVRDLGSMLGTQVNESFLGTEFPSDFTNLQEGENIIRAGGNDSPFRFRIVVERQ